MRRLSRRKVVEEDVESLGFDTVVSNDDGGTSNDLSRDTFLVQFAETGPLSENFRVRDLSNRTVSVCAL